MLYVANHGTLGESPCTYTLLALSQTVCACLGIVHEAGSPSLFANYAWIYVANLFANRSQSRTSAPKLHTNKVHELIINEVVCELVRKLIHKQLMY